MEIYGFIVKLGSLIQVLTMNKFYNISEPQL